MALQMTFQMLIPELVTNAYFQLFYMVSTTLLAIYFYLRTRNRKRLAFESFSKRLFDGSVFDEHEIGVSVTYKRKRISRLSRCYLLLSNGGNRNLVFKDDINRILVSVPDGEQVLRAGVLSIDDKANLCEAKVVDQCADLRFDYLRVRESVIFFVDHTGQENTEHISISPREKNLIRRSRYGRKFHSLALVASAVVFAGSVGGLVLGVLIGISSFGMLEPIISESIWRGGVSTIIGLASIALVWAMIFMLITLFIETYLPARFGQAVVTFQGKIKGESIDSIMDEIMRNA